MSKSSSPAGGAVVHESQILISMEGFPDLVRQMSKVNNFRKHPALRPLNHNPLMVANIAKAHEECLKNSLRSYFDLILGGHHQLIDPVRDGARIGKAMFQSVLDIDIMLLGEWINGLLMWSMQVANDREGELRKMSFVSEVDIGEFVGARRLLHATFDMWTDLVIDNALDIDLD